jgi:hypothetical protein
MLKALLAAAHSLFLSNLASARPDESAPDGAALPQFMTVVRRPERVRQ